MTGFPLIHRSTLYPNIYNNVDIIHKENFFTCFKLISLCEFNFHLDLKPMNLLVTFDITSLFTEVPIPDSIKIIEVLLSRDH